MDLTWQMIAFPAICGCVGFFFGFLFGANVTENAWRQEYEELLKQQAHWRPEPYRQPEYHQPEYRPLPPIPKMIDINQIQTKYRR